ncbi:MAG: M23 family metallopeptidase [Chloroflexota bacterium]|nr:M23 family metallopeptidase [Chloroflexota bacterium]
MDDARFDAMTKATLVTGSRRETVSGLVLGALGLSGLLLPDAAEAHDPSSRCKKIPNKKKRQKCVKDGKKHKLWHKTHACRGQGQNCNLSKCCSGLSCSASFICVRRAEPQSRLTFRFPLSSSQTSYFRFKELYGSSFGSWSGTYHNGVDYHVAANASVYAVADGVVYRKRYDTDYGYYVMIRHTLLAGNGGGTVYSLYAHLANYDGTPAEGQPVQKDRVIGAEGKSGTGAGNTYHLHFELRKPSGVDPWNTNPYPTSGAGPSHDINNFYDPDVFIPANA